MRARMALMVAGQAFELREVVLSRKPVELTQASAKATVPVLIDTDGCVIDESLDIMLWALHRHDPLLWLAPQDGMAETMQWVKRCDGEFKHHLDRYKYPDRFDITDRCEPRSFAAKFLVDLNQRLESSSCLTGPHWGLADAAIAPFVRQFAHTDRVWFASQPWQRLQAWLEKFETSKLFQSIMVVQPPWQS
jgi:glutathione S-transferase